MKNVKVFAQNVVKILMTVLVTVKKMLTHEWQRYYSCLKIS